MRGARGSIERNANAVGGNLERAIRIARGNRQLPAYLLFLVALISLSVLISQSSDWTPSAVFDNADSITVSFPSETDSSDAKAEAGAEKTLVWETPWLGVTKEEYLISGTKYLYVPTAGDLCMGMGHFKWSLVCRLSEAAFLNRTLVLDTMVCLNGAHTNEGYGLVRPLYAYFDLHELKSHLPFTPLQGFRTVAPSAHLSTLIAPKLEPAAALAEGVRRDVQLIIRNLTSSTDFGFASCDAPEGASLPRNWTLLPMRKELQWVISNITLQMNNSNYDVVHVRRGDKVLDSKRWPNLDKDTRPDSLLKRLLELVQPGRFLYISTDERSPGFFDPLKEKFNVRMLGDFKDLWAPGSAWYQVYSDMLGKDVTFDSYMEAMVDYEVTRLAQKAIETFNDLTSDPRDGMQS
ncbi:unnamed protein product [Closterium sp. NIES-64]|nr:unnamed protein product [Closterium sp. NIES-64]